MDKSRGATASFGMINQIILFLLLLLFFLLTAAVQIYAKDKTIDHIQDIIFLPLLLFVLITVVEIYAEDKAIAHIQEKYETTYASNEYESYLELVHLNEYENYLDELARCEEEYDAEHFVPIKSNIYPEAEIYVVVNDIFGEATYRDNFLAYVYHDEAQQKIEEAISAVYSDFWMYFPVPSAVFDLDPETTGVKEYLSEDDADIKITLLAYDQEANDKKLDALVESFKKNGIAVECTVVFTSREQGGAAASEDALQTYMSKTGWYDDIAEFSIRSNGQLEYRKWRK